MGRVAIARWAVANSDQKMDKHGVALLSPFYGVLPGTGYAVEPCRNSNNLCEKKRGRRTEWFLAAPLEKSPRIAYASTPAQKRKLKARPLLSGKKSKERVAKGNSAKPKWSRRWLHDKPALLGVVKPEPPPIRTQRQSEFGLPQSSKVARKKGLSGWLSLQKKRNGDQWTARRAKRRPSKNHHWAKGASIQNGTIDNIKKTRRRKCERQKRQAFNRRVVSTRILNNS